MAVSAPVSFVWAGYLLGFALGGFFDGILLHQILQWHHLLSAVDGADIRFQVAADGWFHALMYVIAAVGLWLLWRARRRDGAGDRLLAAALLIGFGAWHVLDGVLSHWLLGIHRIRMDSGSPLLWDLLWLVAFGGLPLLVGWWLQRTLAPARTALAPCLAALLVFAAGAQALRQPVGAAFATALFPPGTSAAEAFGAVTGAGGRIVWTDRSGQVVIFATDEMRHPFALYRQGAVFVGGAGLPAGCFAKSRI